MAIIEPLEQKYFLLETSSKDIGYIKSDDISKSCDICNEGSSYGRKHRLHLYTKPTYDTPSIACFNCGYKGNMYSYLRDYHPTLFDQYKKEKMGSTFKELKLSKNKNKNSNNETTEDINLDNIFSSHKTKHTPILGDLPKSFKPLLEFEEPIKYLKNRKIENYDRWYFSPKDNNIVFNGAEVRLSEYIIIPFYKEDKIYGFQALSYKQKRFFVFLLKGNDSWKVENWFNIDREKNIYVFESVYDRLSSGLDNTISQMGASLSVERIEELNKNKLVFCLDNQNIDEASQRESLKYAEKGYNVFIWPTKIPKKFKDTNDLLKGGVPKEKIKEIIENNTFSGTEAILRLKMI